MVQRILVATDDSKLSRKATKAAIDLAARLDADLVALHVVPRYPMSYFEGAISLSPSEIRRTEKEWADRGHAITGKVAAEAEKAGVKARGIIAQGDSAADAILAAAKKHKCDLVVMASHGRRGIGRILLGSETQHVLTHGTVPVLVLR